MHTDKCKVRNPAHAFFNKPKCLTNLGIAQGDCLSTVLFIYYLARSLNPPSNESDHNYSRAETPIDPDEHHDHNYHRTTLSNYFEIDPKYADDITWVSTATYHINHIKATVPSTSKKWNLKGNETKTEEFKMWAFSAYIESVFLYNSEIWILTKNLENAINTFQHRQLRNILGIHWPQTISNKELYARTKTEPWNTTVRRWCLNWLGHLMHLHPDTPAKAGHNRISTKSEMSKRKTSTHLDGTDPKGLTENQHQTWSNVYKKHNWWTLCLWTDKRQRQMACHSEMRCAIIQRMTSWRERTPTYTCTPT